MNGSTPPEDLLVPRPRRVSRHGRVLALSPRGGGDAHPIAPRVELGPSRSGDPLVEHLRGRIEVVRRALRWPRDASLDVTWTDGETGRSGDSEAYRLDVSASGVSLRARAPIGAFRGWITFEKWLALHEPGPLPGVVIDDDPDLSTRGYLLDVSRDRVPTMERLRELVTRLSWLGYNQLQLYTEHAFAYAGHEEVWRDASPLTPEEIRALDLECRARGIELVPNQNSFGHFHRWLTHERYRSLAECPEGFVTPFTPHGEPYSLCAVDPRVPGLLRDLYAQLLPNFTSREFNVGLDETFDLGAGRSAEAVRERGADRVYLEYLLRVRDLAAEHGRTLQFWGDVILTHPTRIPELPQDATALAWGYEADHPFDADAGRFAASGLRFLLCPGTSAWNSIGGRIENARANISRAAAAARRHGARGILVCDWGDFGHWQPPVVSDPGVLFGAALGWNAAAHDAWSAQQWQRALDLWIYGRLVRDDARSWGRAVWTLGEVAAATQARNKNGSPLFRFLLWADRPWPHEEIEGVTDDGLARAAACARSALDSLPATRADEAGTSGQEIEWVSELLVVAADLGRARLRAGPGHDVRELPREVRADLAARLVPLRSRFESLWLRGSRPGGLRESSARFAHLLDLIGSP